MITHFLSGKNYKLRFIRISSGLCCEKTLLRFIRADMMKNKLYQSINPYDKLGKNIRKLQNA